MSPSDSEPKARRVGFLCGLGAEARIARDFGFPAIACGGQKASAERAIADLIAAGADLLVSFGITGALAPDLAPGTILIADAVMMPEGDARWADRDRLRRLTEGQSDFRIGHILGSSRIIAIPEDKALIFRQTSCVAVDQESQYAAASGKPFLVLRAIADGAGESLPAAILNGLDAQGRTRPGAVLATLLRRPGDIPATLRAAWRTRQALCRLREALAKVVDILAI